MAGVNDEKTGQETPDHVQDIKDAAAKEVANRLVPDDAAQARMKATGTGQTVNAPAKTGLEPIDARMAATGTGKTATQIMNQPAPAQPQNFDQTLTLGNVKQGPMPKAPNAVTNTLPAAAALGLSESDVPSGHNATANPQGPPANTIAAKGVGPVVGQKANNQPATAPAGPIAPGAYDSSAVGGADYRAQSINPDLSNPNKQLDPVKEASAQPGFWDRVKSLGGDIFTALGDIGKGLQHLPTYTEQRLQREHEERMQGKASQYQKDYLSLQQGFQQKQYDADNTYRAKDQALQAQIASTTDANTKQQLLQQKQANDNQYEIEKQKNEIDKWQAQNSLGFQYLAASQTRQTEGTIEGVLDRLTNGGVK